MARVYTTTPGAVMQVDYHGWATEDEPCRVPEAVGRELAGVEGLRVELDEQAPEPEIPARRKKNQPSALEGGPAQVKEG